MKIGLQIPNFTWPGGPTELAPKLADIARTADDAGFASLWVMDHFFQIEFVGPADHDMLEGYSTLAFLAGLTRKVRLGTMVTGVTYRHPGVLAKTVASLDVLSGGRAWLGVGAAWYDREHAGLGVPFPPLGERFERLEETLQICRQMWSDDDGPYRGRHYQLEETLCVPRPLSRPRPPILIGGLGEKKTLRLVARYAEACNLFTMVGMDVVKHKLEVLARHCEDVGRDPNEIECTTLGVADFRPGRQSAADVVAECRTLAEMGVQHAIYSITNVEDVATVETFGREIIPEAAGL